MVTPRWAVSVWVIGCLACSFGCSDDEPRLPHDASTQDGAVEAGADTGVDAARPEDGGEPDGSPPWSFDASFFDASGIPGCLSSVAAECDGPEDCGDKICCANIDPAALGYRDIACKSDCNIEEGGFALCHVNQQEFPCSSDGTRECRRSLLLPHAFIGICAPKTPFATGKPSGESVSGLIECGATRCEVGTEKCCMTVSFDIAADQSFGRSAHCLPIDAECDCESSVEPPIDAGIDATKPVEDAMVDAMMSIDDDAGL